MINMIVAHDKNKAIGRSNTLPWDVPEDLRFFSKVTRDKVVVMGEKTYESIGRLLPSRTNIILSKNCELKIEGAVIFNDIEPLIQMGKLSEFFVIGGGQIYKAFLPYAENLYITQLDIELEDADTFFPSYEQDFECLIKGEKNHSETQDIDYQFTLWRKKKK